MSWEGVRPFDPAVARVDPDTAAIEAVRAGDPHAFAALIGRYQDRIYSMVAHLVNDHEDAVDLTQEIFVKAYRGLNNFRAAANFYTWLYRIAVRHCIDYGRRRRRRVEALSLDRDLSAGIGPEFADPSVHADPERAVVNRHLGAEIRAAIASLPEPSRTAVVLHDIEGLSHREIAAIMQCPPNTAKTRIHRGRVLMREYLRDTVEA